MSRRRLCACCEIRPDRGLSWLSGLVETAERVSTFRRYVTTARRRRRGRVGVPGIRLPGALRRLPKPSPNSPKPTPPHPTPPRIHPRRGGRQRKPWDKRGLGDVVDGIGVGEASGCVAAGKIAHLIADIEAQSPSVASPLGRPRRLELSRAERLLRCGAQRER